MAATATAPGNAAVGQVPTAQQTTAGALPLGPFPRQSRKCQEQAFGAAGLAYGALITQPLPSVGGFLRGFSVTVAGNAGVWSVAPTGVAPDAPYNVITLIQLRDSKGTPIVILSGYDLMLVNLFGGQCGVNGTQNPAARPSFTPMALSTSSGAFRFHLFIPLELDSSGYCSFADMNASAPPKLSIQLNQLASVWTGGTLTTAPTITFTVNQLYWAMVPAPNQDLAPPDIGSSAQWSEVEGGTQPGAGSNTRVRDNRVQTLIHTLIAVVRDSANLRQGVFPASDLTLWVDDSPWLNTQLLIERYDELYGQFQIVAGADGAQPLAQNGQLTNGVLVYSERDSVETTLGGGTVSGADTHDGLLPTTNATKLEVGGTWGSGGTPPYTVTFITGELFPANPAGIPWSHLAS